MKRYTKAQIIAERRCGLKAFDDACSYIAIELIIEKAIYYHNDLGGLVFREKGWASFNWAFANAIKDVLWESGNKKYADKEICIGANLDEMLSDDQMLYVAQKIGLSLPDTDARKRKLK